MSDGSDKKEEASGGGFFSWICGNGYYAPEPEPKEPQEFKVGEKKADDSCPSCGNPNCNCSCALREHLKQCCGYGQLPPLITKDSCPAPKAAAQACVVPPTMVEDCIPPPPATECNIPPTLERAQRSKCTMPESDVKTCIPTWICPPTKSEMKTFTVPEGEEILPISVGGRGSTYDRLQSKLATSSSSRCCETSTKRDCPTFRSRSCSSGCDQGEMKTGGGNYCDDTVLFARIGALIGEKAKEFTDMCKEISENAAVEDRCRCNDCYEERVRRESEKCISSTRQSFQKCCQAQTIQQSSFRDPGKSFEDFKCPPGTRVIRQTQSRMCQTAPVVVQKPPAPKQCAPVVETPACPPAQPAAIVESPEPEIPDPCLPPVPNVPQAEGPCPCTEQDVTVNCCCWEESEGPKPDEKPEPIQPKADPCAPPPETVSCPPDHQITVDLCNPGTNQQVVKTANGDEILILIVLPKASDVDQGDPSCRSESSEQEVNGTPCAESPVDPCAKPKPKVQECARPPPPDCPKSEPPSPVECPPVVQAKQVCKEVVDPCPPETSPPQRNSILTSICNCRSCSENRPVFEPPKSTCGRCGEARGENNSCPMCRFVNNLRGPCQPKPSEEEAEEEDCDCSKCATDICESTVFEMNDKGKPIYEGGMCLTRAQNFLWQSTDGPSFARYSFDGQTYEGYGGASAEDEIQCTCEEHMKMMEEKNKYVGGMSLDKARDYLLSRPEPK